MSDRLFLISTVFTKVPAEPKVLNFMVECREEDPDRDPLAPRPDPIGWLSGFVADHGYLPLSEDDWYLDVFDMRSGHANEAFRILVNQRARIEKALPGSDLMYTGSGVALLERAWIDPEFRGRRLALRLMREARHVFGRSGLLVMLKAHPDGDKVTAKACVALADYYLSDKWLGLKEVSRRSLPGWLVAHWDGPDASPGDESYWDDQVND